MTERNHGTIGRYAFGATGRSSRNGCRCDLCRAASRRSDLRRQLHGPAYIDGAAVARHMRQCLAAGMTNHQIAVLAGLGEGGRTIIRHLLSREGRRLRPQTAAALLAVPVSPCAAVEGASCDATGTRRRLQALVAIGYTERQLAQLLGASATSPLQVARRSRCDGATAIAVATLYDQLANTPGPSEAARKRARLRGWLAPLWWDDDTIDDPTAEPDGVREYEHDRHGREALVRDHTAWRVDEVDRLTRAGRSAGEVAGILGCTRRQVHRDLLAMREAIA